VTHSVLPAAAVVILLGALHLASPVATPFLLALVIAIVLWPVLMWLRRRTSTAVALVLLLTGLVVGGGVLGLVIVSSTGGLLSRLQLYSDNLSAEIGRIDTWLQANGAPDASLASVLSPDAFAAGLHWLTSTLISAVSAGVVVVILVAFFLFEGPAVAKRLCDSLAADSSAPAQLVTLLHDVGQYFLLRALVNAVTGAGVTLALWLLGVDFPLLWGTLTFFLSFIPYVGMLLASIPSVLLAWAEFGLPHAIVVGVALTVVNALAENVVQPALMHTGLRLSPTFVFVSVFFWGWLLGGAGSFLAIPISLAVLALLANVPSAGWVVHTMRTSEAPTAPPTVPLSPPAVR
jgi:AI-2 transport protein TqsA